MHHHAGKIRLSPSNYGSDIPITVIGSESKVFTGVFNIIVGIVLGCQPIIGYNIGSKNFGRVKNLYRSLLLCTLGVGIAATLLFEIAPDAVIGIFGKPRNIPNPGSIGNSPVRLSVSSWRR